MKPRTILIVGASGATGRLLVAELLARGHSVRAIVRSRTGVPAELHGHPQLTVIEGSLLDFGDEALRAAVEGCDAVASCLGHTPSFRGIFGAPRRLVTEAVARLCRAIEASRPERPVRFVLMCSAGVRNRDLDERVSPAQRFVVFLLRLLVPPHADNEQAADYLRARVGREDRWIEWAVIRPDSLQQAERVSPYELHPSPTRSAIFDPGQTSRINVAEFMARLATDDALWRQWRFRMPVIYNRVAGEPAGKVPQQPGQA